MLHLNHLNRFLLVYKNCENWAWLNYSIEWMRYTLFSDDLFFYIKIMSSMLDPQSENFYFNIQRKIDCVSDVDIFMSFFIANCSKIVSLLEIRRHTFLTILASHIFCCNHLKNFTYNIKRNVQIYKSYPSTNI